MLKKQQKQTQHLTETKKVKKERYLIKQNNTQIFNKIIVLK